MVRALTRRIGADQRSVRRFLLTVVALAFVSLVATGIAAALLTAANQRHTRWVAHTYQVEVAIRDAQLLVEQGETTRRGFLLTRQPIYRDTYRVTAAKLEPAIVHLARLTIDNPRQQDNVARYRRMIAVIVAQRGRTIALVEHGRAAEAVGMFVAETAAKRMRAIRDQATAMGAEEQRLLAIRDAMQRQSLHRFYLVVAIAGALLLLLAAATYVVVKRYTRDLDASRASLQGLNDTLEEKVGERTADLTRANEEIQRFAYIVSHDLRSPLVNVMGFTAELATAAAPLGELIDRVEAEAPALLTEEARLAAREDLPEAIGFIRTSTQKMDRLINAILKLSREGRRTITPERLDTDALVAGVVGSVRHLIDERGIEVEIVGPLPPLVGDRVAVEQIVSNLVENAIKYLQPGRPGHITIAGTSDRVRTTLSVVDNGRGIAATDHQRVFDLFRRSGTQDTPGEGIGLAHVRALAHRLGGTIDLTSVLGTGSIFRLVLPATSVPEGTLA